MVTFGAFYKPPLTVMYVALKEFELGSETFSHTD